MILVTEKLMIVRVLEYSPWQLVARIGQPEAFNKGMMENTGSYTTCYWNPVLFILRRCGICVLNVSINAQGPIFNFYIYKF